MALARSNFIQRNKWQSYFGCHHAQIALFPNCFSPGLHRKLERALCRETKGGVGEALGWQVP